MLAASDVTPFVPLYIRNNLNHLLHNPQKLPRPLPLTYLPETCFSPVVFCKYCDTAIYSQVLARLPLCQKVLSSFISQTDIPHEVTHLITKNIVYFTAALLQSRSPDQLSGLIHQRVDSPHLFTLCERYLTDLKAAQEDIFHDLTQKEKFYLDVKDFYLEVLNLTYYLSDLRQAHPTYHLLPSYLPRTLKNRLLLLSLLPDKTKVKDLINTLTPKMNNCSGRFILPGYYVVTPELFGGVLVGSLSSKPIPAKIRHHIVTPFEQYIWKGHLYTPPKLKSRSEEYESEQVGFQVTFPDHVLIAQVICLLQPNWQQLWYMMNWPRPVEICQRLLFLKEEEAWSPNYELLVDFVINST